VGGHGLLFHVHHVEASFCVEKSIDLEHFSLNDQNSETCTFTTQTLCAGL